MSAVDLARPALARAPRHLRVHHLGLVPYELALGLQESLLEACVGGGEEDVLLLLEHPAVYTLGRGADARDLRDAPRRLGVPVFRVGRGGGVTFHGPGQLVGYPIVRLPGGSRGVHGYIRALEAGLITTCRHYGVAAVVRNGLTGVWVEDEKIASIGIGVRRGVAYHGVALNVSTDLSYFAHVVPCRAPHLALTSLQRQLGWAPPVQEVGRVLAARLAGELGLSVYEAEEHP